MIGKSKLIKVVGSILLAVVPALCQEQVEFGKAGAPDAKASKVTITAPSAVGSWWGIARPCPADVKTDSPTHLAFCQAVCGDCASIPNTLPPEVPMMPTLFSDGTVMADDAGEMGRYHTTATGFWQPSSNDGLPDIPGTIRYKATFFWLGSTAQSPTDFGTCCFSNTVRPRFIAYFDPKDPDRMMGFIQPYASPTVDAKTGLVIVNPFNPTDPKAGNHQTATALDLIGGALPKGCQNNLGCLGTYHFVIRRIKAE